MLLKILKKYTEILLQNNLQVILCVFFSCFTSCNRLETGFSHTHSRTPRVSLNFTKGTLLVFKICTSRILSKIIRVQLELFFLYIFVHVVLFLIGEREQLFCIVSCFTKGAKVCFLVQIPIKTKHILLLQLRIKILTTQCHLFHFRQIV